jgi:hypothetical protein
MDWIRRDPKVAVVLSALAVLCVVIMVWGVTGAPGSSGSAATLGTPVLATPTATPARLLDGMPTPSGPASAERGAGAGMSTYTGRSVLQGHSLSESIPRHRVVLSLTSSQKIPFVIYNVPTSRDHSAGQGIDLGSSWSLTTTAYGKPDYARIITRAGPEGVPITCTITVDGQVAARLTTEGPWGKILCQG